MAERTRRRDPRNGSSDVNASPPAKGPLDVLRSRAKAAWGRKSSFDHLYREAFDYAIPFRRSAGSGQGEARTDKIFDQTALVSTFRFAGNFQNDFFPVGQSFFALEVGAAAKARLPKGDIDKLQAALEGTTALVSSVFLTGEWDMAVSEMGADLAAGTGAILVLEGDDETPVRFMAVPIDELALEKGAFNRITGIFWKTRMSRRALKDQFPHGRFSAKFEEELAKNGETLVEVCQDTIRVGKIWRKVVHVRDQDEAVEEEDFRTCPWITPRYYVVPGEEYGRGPILLAMPTIKVLNKAMELTLRSAALSLLGIWLYRPGEFNPDSVQMAPGAWWPVTATGGVLGASVTQLHPNANMDVSNLVVSEMRTQVQQTLHDEQLPAEGATPRSAAEIVERIKRLRSHHIGAFGRLINEIIPPVVSRVIEIMAKKGLLDVGLTVDQLLVAIKVTSPLAAALKADNVTRWVQWVQLIAALGGQALVEQMVKLADMMEEAGGEIGVPRRFMNDSETREKIAEGQRQQAAAAAAMEFAAKSGVMKAAGGLSGGATPET